MFRKWAKRGSLACLPLLAGVLYVDDARTNPFKYRVQNAFLHLDAWYFDRVHGERKRQLFASMGSGRVLELGPGTGRNFKYLPKSVDWTGVEINPTVTSTLFDNAAREGFPPIILQLKTENLREYLKSCGDNSVDAVLSIKVLCCLKDADAVLSDINRVLKPGGRLYFVESTPPWGIFWGMQQFLAPLRFLLTGTRSNTNVVRGLHEAFQDVYVENWPGAVNPEDVRAGIRKISYSKEAGVSSMKGSIINQCVVAGVCSKGKRSLLRRLP